MFFFVTKTKFHQHTLQKTSNIKSYENSSTGKSSCAMWTDRQADMTKLTVTLPRVTFCYWFANAPRNVERISKCCFTQNLSD